MSSLIDQLNQRIDAINPIQYGKYRNFLDGPVTQLSPYISRGVISTRYVLESLKSKGFSWNQLERLAQQLSWRDYFQRVYQHFPNLAEQNVKNNPTHFISEHLPKSISSCTTGISAIDQGINNLLHTGMMHNHMRMYVAMLTTNIAKTHWKAGANWMYYHLLDADIAANFLSWQWVSGAFSSKLYYANQENINRYTKTIQRNTFLDCEYEDFKQLTVPSIFRERWVSGDGFSGDGNLLQNDLSSPNANLEKLNDPKDLEKWKHSLLNQPQGYLIPIYTIYNLDIQWKNQTDAPKLILLDRNLLEKHPMSSKTIDFIFQVSLELKNAIRFYGSWEELQNWLQHVKPDVKCVFKEHPTQKHYQGIQVERDWICPEITQYFPSFFGYWKAYEKISRKAVSHGK
jgi:deoxyribodipyrimidine photo-lyase